MNKISQWFHEREEIINRIYHSLMFQMRENPLFSVAIELLCVVFICGAMLVFYHQHYPPLKVATVDIVKISKSAVKHIAELSLDEKASKEALQQVVAELENTLKAFALDHHCVILPKEAVIEGAMNITEFVEPLIENSDE